MESKDNWKGKENQDVQFQRKGCVTLRIWVMDNYEEGDRQAASFNQALAKDPSQMFIYMKDPLQALG